MKGEARLIMSDVLSREILDLTGAELVRLTEAEGISLYVRAGTASVMQQGSRDIVLKAGARFLVDRSDLVLVVPIDAVTLEISAQPARARSSRLERIQSDGRHYPVLSGRLRPALVEGSRLSPAF
ncbi:MAG: hypothetical protein LJE97_10215 [Betaproteobacteria bacterium]|jgi:hypothetical protein|nr:hypothetical protein [Betaproteobacteria bacterium]